MPLSSIDLLSPKITLYYNGRNSHISHFGGLLSLIFLFLLIIAIFHFLYIIVDPQINSAFIYEQNINDIKYNQSFDDSGINHFIQIYSQSNSGWFGDFDNKNIIIYSIKETNKNKYNNDGQTKFDLYTTEHWVYDKCENIFEINKKIFSEISKTISNYSKPICLRFYYNPIEQEYYEFGHNGYISPNLETNFLSEKRVVYKIIIERCFNNSIFSDKFQKICNNENEIIKYLSLYSDIFIYFSNNQIIPKKINEPFEKYFYSISSPIHKMSYLENNIIFSPIKLTTNKNIFKKKRENLSYILRNYYQNKLISDEQYATIGLFNFYFNNNLIIYQRKYTSIIDCLSNLGGIGQLLFFIFQIINYINSHYTTIENSKNLFKINTGIDTSNLEGNEIVLDKMRHLNSHNYKIKVFNNNNIVNNEDFNLKYMRNIQTKNKPKSKYANYEYHGANGNKSSTKNLGILPVNNSHRKKNNLEIKKIQTKYTKTFKQMGKQFSIKNKRKSYMSVGYLIKKKDYSTCSKNSKNQSINDNEINNEIISNNNNINNIINENNNSSFLFFKEAKEKELKEGINKKESKNIIDNNSRRYIKKKTNFKRHLGTPIFEGTEIPQPNIKKIDPNIKGRHKSVNFGNQRGDFFFSSNLLGIKNMFYGKNSSEYVNDSSKQVFVQNKNPFQAHNNRFQIEKNKYDELAHRTSIVNNNENNNNSNNNNLNTIIYNPNSETASYLKNIIQSKIKLIMPEIKQDYSLINFLETKTKYLQFFKYLFICNKRAENNVNLINNFRIKLLSEEHLYKVHINLYLLEKIFQIDEPYRFDINELFNNL